LTSEQGLDEGTDVTVVFAVVTRTFNEDKLMISQRKIMYHMARSEVAPRDAREPDAPETAGRAGRDRTTADRQAETIANRDDDDARSPVVGRRAADIGWG
jgi:hypothetical protein